MYKATINYIVVSRPVYGLESMRAGGYFHYSIKEVTSLEKDVMSLNYTTNRKLHKHNSTYTLTTGTSRARTVKNRRVHNDRHQR